MAFPVVQSSSTANGVSSAAVAKPTGLAAGDLMLGWAVSGDQTDPGTGGPSAPDGTWNAIKTGSATQVGSASWWKIATSTDVAASTFTFTCSTNASSSRILAGIMRITGHDPSSPINGSNNATGTTGTSLSTSGITPALLQSLLLILVCGAKGTTGGATAASGYAIASNNPSWTEIFDATSSGGGSGFELLQLSAAWANETAAAGVATGNATATLNAAPTYSDIQIIAITPPITVQPTILGGALSLPMPTFLRQMTVAILGVVGAVINPVIDIIAPTWKNASKSETSWENVDKSPNS